MQEVTRIYTVEIIKIEKGYAKDIIPHEQSKKDAEKYIQKLKKSMGVDDIKIVKVQDFVRDVQTNFEKMKGMNRKELAEFLTEITDACLCCGSDSERDHGSYEMQGICPFGKCKPTITSFKKWLNEEAKND